MTTKIWSWAALACVALTLTGCAFGRDEIRLAETGAIDGKSRVASNGRTVFVRTVTDERVFSKDGDDAGSPSVGPDGDNADVRARLVSRKRNGYGMALGDVTLETGQTVAGQVGEAVRQAFRQAGYTVVTEAAGPSTLVVDVHVKKFWTWRRKGFTAITLLSDIQTELTISGAKSGPTQIAVHIEDEKLVAGPDATIESLDKALSAYRAEAVTKLSNLKT